MTTTTMRLPGGYDRGESELGLTNGAARVSLGIRSLTDHRGASVVMTPDTARALAADLIARAEYVEARLAED